MAYTRILYTYFTIPDREHVIGNEVYKLDVHLENVFMFTTGMKKQRPKPCQSATSLCLFVCGISLTSGQLINELFPDCTRSFCSQVVSRRRGGDRIYEMRCLFVAVGLNARFIVLPHWDNMS